MLRRLSPLVLLISFGCQAPSPPVGGELPERVYGRVVSLSPSTTELMGLLRLENFLIGRTASDTKPLTIRHVTIVSNPRPDIEKIIKLQPDLVIGDAGVINPADLEKLREHAGKDSYDLEIFPINSVEDWKNAVWKLGSLMMRLSEASKAVDDVDQAIRINISDPLESKPKTLIVTGSDKPWVAGTQTFQADVIRKAGGEPVGPDAKDFRPVNQEQILSWNPDVVLTTEDVASLHGPAWDALASKNRIYQVHADLLLRPGADVANLITAVGRVLRNPGARR